MKAVFTPKYGSPEVLEIRETPVPTIGPDDLLIEVRAATVTEGDRRMRAADYPGVFKYLGQLATGIGGPRKPMQGTNYAGRVVAVGANVTKFAVGDDVFGGAAAGTWSELLAVDASSAIAKMPSNMSYDEAAAIPYGAVTSLYFLRDLAGVRKGERVLILGASGGVGRWAVQIARAMGAEVTGVASAANAELVRSLGASHVLDYAVDDFAAGDIRYDVVFDIAGASSFSHARRVLRAGGRYLTVYADPSVVALMLLTGLFGGRRVYTGVALSNAEQLATLRDFAERGEIRPQIGETFDLDEIAAAHHAEERIRNAAVVVRPNGAYDASWPRQIHASQLKSTKLEAARAA